jgi:hypothetical protein
MSKQHHFVVYFDDKTLKWDIEWETSINYDEGDVWDTEAEAWGFSEPEDSIINDLRKRLGDN